MPQDDQDWEPVVWTKKKTGAGAGAAEQLRAAVRTGTAKPVEKNSAARVESARLHKLEQTVYDDGPTTRLTVTKLFSLQLQRARLAKSLTQKALAALVSEKVTVINDYESGKASPNQQVIQKLNQALGVQLGGNKPKKKHKT
jgi:putative transcription factor